MIAQEFLLESAEEVEDVHADFSKPAALAVLGGVCRYWRECTVGTPALWRSILVRDRPEWLDLCLERSQSLKLSIVFVKPSLFVASSDILFQNIDRIQILALCSASEVAHELLDRLLDAPMPALEELRVDSANEEDCWFFGDKLSASPFLHTVCFSHVGLDWHSVGVQRLRSIKLNDWRNHDPNEHMPFADFLRCLGACRNLEELFLDYAFPCISVARQVKRADPIPPISLPRLRFLSLIFPPLCTFFEAQSAPNLYHFFAHINIPLTAEVEIYVQVDDDYRYVARDRGFPEYFRDYLPCDPARLPILRAATAATITPTYFRCAVDGADVGSLWLEIAHVGSRVDNRVPQYERFLQDAYALLKEAPIKRVHISRVDASVEAWREFFKTFLAIEDLTIGRCGVNIREECMSALEALGDPSDIALKDLRVLKIEKMEWTSELADAIAQALRVRSKEGATPLTGLRLRMYGLDRNSAESMAFHEAALATLRSLVDGIVSYEDWKLSNLRGDCSECSTLSSATISDGDYAR
ncbi:uncharacterized protein TRAVEDRAFT_53058 [Trametes versicolor FP-101664 SS1]|uniref:uncharacterized protein n=1 Tax=Trametes versicolor (strain FP-101664) TaxID=717944 RepID=UPI0004623F06|nr:uncharacterized protein TRAVEDRAFT_53058 [Trametes versicolor FP-101664 SS1]EIW52617.1 hypothetical protein TRAVEDRAFT_53058 [Trametes versicolor FP-101664 SS1]